MKTCTDCIHCDVCPKESYATDISPYIDFSRINDVDECCVDFKDKSKCIELPCLSGDTVYRLDYSLPTCFIEPEVNFIKRIYINENHIVFDCEDEFAFRDIDIGESVFLTREDAEKKFKEVIHDLYRKQLQINSNR